MTTLALLSGVYKTLNESSLSVLRLVEREMRRFEYVPADRIASLADLPPKRLDSVLRELTSKKLLRRFVGHVVGYRLTFLGLDVLAVDALVKRGLIAAIGERVGTGKESDIIEVLSPSGERLALKLHKVGRRSFRKTVRVRPYVFERETRDWLEESKLSAEREFRALSELAPRTPYVPRPLAHNRHAVVTEFIEGVELYRVRSLEKPREVLEKIVEVVEVAFTAVGIVHGDLSEYNVIVAFPEEKPVVIDWPQYYYRDSPTARELLRRDLEYVANFFKRKFGVVFNWWSVYEKLVSEIPTA